MEEKVLEVLVASFTKTILSEGKTLFDEIYDKSYDEIKQFIGKDIKNYLNKQKDKYSHIKTLLRGNTPVYLYDVYFPAKLINEHSEVINTDSSSNLLDIFSYITIIGEAGSGKSTLVKHLFLNSIYEKNRIPILIELRYLNETSDDLESYIKNTITQNKISVNSTILEKLLDKGKFTLFLDGFDEVDEKTKKKLVKQINDFVNKYNSNCYVITSRPYSHAENLPLFTNLKMKELSFENGEITGFVYKQLGSETEVAKKAIKSIEQGESKYIHSFLKNPLLLSLYLLTFQSYASIPDKKYIFYRRVINALFSEHDSKTKLGYVREKLCGLDQEGFETILKSFSFLSYFENEFTFNADYVNLKIKFIKDKKGLKFDINKFLADLKSAISIWIDDEGQYSFAHRSLQEYFTALFISELKDDENTRVYKKLINKYQDSSPRNTSREMENLLQLLKEMDEYNFIKKLYHPLLMDLKKDILSNNLSSNGRNYLKFFIQGLIEIKMNNDNEIRYTPFLGENINKTFFIHLEFTRELYLYLSKFLQSSDGSSKVKKINFVGNSKNKKPDNQRENKRKHLIFNKKTFEEFYNLTDKILLNRLSNEILSYINKEIEFSENYISQTDATEKDLVDLI